MFLWLMLRLGSDPIGDGRYPGPIVARTDVSKCGPEASKNARDRDASAGCWLPPDVGFDDLAVDPGSRSAGEQADVMRRQEGKESRVVIQQRQSRRLRKMGCGPCILSNLVTNGPWTAWRTLDRVPRYSDQQAESATAPMEKVHKHPQPPRGLSIAGLSHALSSAAPVFRLEATQPVKTSAPAGAAAGPESLREAALVGTARALMDKVDINAVPATETINASQLLAGVSALQLSRTTGAPIERAEIGLERLRSVSTDAAPSATGSKSAYPVVEQAALVAAARAAAGSIGPFIGSAPEADEASETTGPPRLSDGSPMSITIEDVSSELRTTAARLTSEQDVAHQDEASQLSTRLQVVADQLLQSARFVIVADMNGGFRYGNGAITTLLANGIPAETRGSVLAGWQSVLNSAPLGRSELTSLIANAAPGGPAVRQPPLSSVLKHVWILDRTEVKDSANNAVQGYVNILRVKDAPVLPQQTLAKIDAMRSDLTLYSSLYVHGSESRDMYLSRIDSLTTNAEHLISAVIA
jgi:hypothetical protein